MPTQLEVAERRTIPLVRPIRLDAITEDTDLALVAESIYADLVSREGLSTLVNLSLDGPSSDHDQLPFDWDSRSGP